MSDAMVTAICSMMVSLVTIILGFIQKYNQRTKDKMTDLKIDLIKKEADQRSYMRSKNSATVYSELHEILYRTKAIRVYVIQPHPLGNSDFLSIQYEVKRKGISGMKDNVQSLPMCDMAVFCRSLTDNLYMYYPDINTDIKDKMAKSLLSVNGCKAVAIKRLNSATDWVGNIFCEFSDDPEVPEEEIQKALQDAAVNIQFILPEFKEVPIK